jgi:hypothetical protein
MGREAFDAPFSKASPAATAAAAADAKTEATAAKA